jgi:hypothetical protein
MYDRDALSTHAIQRLWFGRLGKREHIPEEQGMASQLRHVNAKKSVFGATDNTTVFKPKVRMLL